MTRRRGSILVLLALVLAMGAGLLVAVSGAVLPPRRPHAAAAHRRRFRPRGRIGIHRRRSCGRLRARPRDALRPREPRDGRYGDDRHDRRRYTREPRARHARVDERGRVSDAQSRGRRSRLDSLTAHRVIKTVVLFPNGMVAVCDELGHQLGGLQGSLNAVRHLIGARSCGARASSTAGSPSSSWGAAQQLSWRGAIVKIELEGQDARDYLDMRERQREIHELLSKVEEVLEGLEILGGTYGRAERRTNQRLDALSTQVAETKAKVELTVAAERAEDTQQKATLDEALAEIERLRAQLQGSVTTEEATAIGERIAQLSTEIARAGDRGDLGRELRDPLADRRRLFRRDAPLQLRAQGLDLGERLVERRLLLRVLCPLRGDRSSTFAFVSATCVLSASSR